MTPGARVWNSTLAGRSVLRTAASVQYASLRSRGLIAGPGLRILANPLAAVLVGPPGFDMLEDALDALNPPDNTRRSRGSVDAPRRGRRVPGPMRLDARDDTVLNTAVRPAATDLAALTGFANPAAAGATPDAHQRAHTARGASPTSGASQRAGLAMSASTPSGTFQPSRRQTRAPAELPSVSTNDLAIAAGFATKPSNGDARADRSSAATSTAGPTGDQLEDPRAANSEAPSFAVGEPPISSPTTRTAPDMSPADTGALGELVSRWQRSSAVPNMEPSIPSLNNAPSTAPQYMVTSPEPTASVLTVEHLERVVDEMLRRESEQHGLIGGLL